MKDYRKGRNKKTGIYGVVMSDHAELSTIGRSTVLSGVAGKPERSNKVTSHAAKY